eukprot:10147377-Ditylum_brightwellii.AAC.1
MAALSHFGFVTTAIMGDGATENCCMFIEFVTLTADMPHGIKKIVMSATALHLIDAYADDCDGKDVYAPLCTIVEKVDTLVDIMNSRV